MSARRLIIAGCVLAGISAHAADVIVLSDPTRPPGAVLNAMRSKAMGGQGGAQGGAPQAAAPASAPASGAETPKPAKPVNRLTSVRVSPGYGSVALLDERLVQVGDRVGDSTVAAIDDDGVTLRGPKGMQRLSLTPAANKTWPARAAPAAGGARKETR